MTVSSALPRLVTSRGRPAASTLTACWLVLVACTRESREVDAENGEAMATSSSPGDDITYRRPETAATAVTPESVSGRVVGVVPLSSPTPVLGATLAAKGT